MIIDILTLFPEYFDSPFEQSILKRAREKRLIETRVTNIRDFATGKHRKVDDRPYGGGPGMVMMPGPICEAIRSKRTPQTHVIYLTPQGKLLTAQDCERLATHPHLILVCGHYEGYDERVAMKEPGEKISIGSYVLSSGNPAAMVIVDACSRLIPGVVGNEESVKLDTFQRGGFKGPLYTRPDDYEGLKVPTVLKSGHHAEIEKWQSTERQLPHK